MEGAPEGDVGRRGRDRGGDAAGVGGPAVPEVDGIAHLAAGVRVSGDGDGVHAGRAALRVQLEEGGAPGGAAEVVEDADGRGHPHPREGAEAGRERADECGAGGGEGVQQGEGGGDRGAGARGDGGPADGEVGGVPCGVGGDDGGRVERVFGDFRGEGRGTVWVVRAIEVGLLFGSGGREDTVGSGLELNGGIGVWGVGRGGAVCMTGLLWDGVVAGFGRGMAN